MTNQQSKQSPSTNSTASSSVSSKLERTKLSCTGTLQKVKRVYLWKNFSWVMTWVYNLWRSLSGKSQELKKVSAMIIRRVNLEAAFFLSTIPSTTTTMQCSEQHEYTSLKENIVYEGSVKMTVELLFILLDNYELFNRIHQFNQFKQELCWKIDKIEISRDAVDLQSYEVIFSIHDQLYNWSDISKELHAASFQLNFPFKLFWGEFCEDFLCFLFNFMN